MCGIYGKFQFDGCLSLGESIAALNTLEHRGPDGFGIEYGDYNTGKYSLTHNEVPENTETEGPNYFLGHRRLSIVDLSDNAFQPMENSCQDCSISFNGEIYNHAELREELKKLGCVFVTDHSDTEVLINAYRTWGIDCLKKLRGMFAFVIFDKKNQSVFLARDRVGQKTLYIESSRNHFSFASELPPIVHFGKKRSISIEALNTYMAMGYIPHPYCIYDGIEKLPPASFGLLDLKTGRFSVEEYWDIDVKEDKETTEDQAVSVVEAILAESVDYRLRADVTIGAFISGGTDSTLIVKNILNTSNKTIDIYGADFPNTNRSEKKYIMAAANRYKQNLILSNINLDHIGNIEKIINVFDEPFDGASSIALFDLFKEASRSHKVILTGDGGDEMFAGYTRYLTFPASEKFIGVLRKLALPKIIANALITIGLKPSKITTLKREIEGDCFENFNGLNSISDLSRLIKPSMKIKKLSALQIFRSILSKIEDKKLSPIKALQYLEFKTILPGRMLYKLDRFSMFYSIEARSPFLDHKLIETAFTIPDKINVDGDITKAVLKKLLSKDFDAEFVHREKQGFGNPLINWFKNSLPQDIFSIALQSNSFIYNYLDYETTIKEFPQLRGEELNGREKSLWRLLVIAHFIENNKQYLHIPE